MLKAEAGIEAATGIESSIAFGAKDWGIKDYTPMN